MSGEQFRSLRDGLGLTRVDCAQLLGLDGEAQVAQLETAEDTPPDDGMRRLAILNAVVETAVLGEVEHYSQQAERDVVLVRFLSDDEFALYEPDLYEQFGQVQLHGAFIARAKRAIERLGGEVSVAFMDSEFYEAWLGVNDFDDSRDLRVAWARQQMRGLTK